jgi:hypothetical protein
MVKTLQGSAQAGMDHAKQVRKDADRSEDVLQRNNLYRQAYAEELRALRDMDRSLTVGNYLLSGQSRPGEALTYEEVEARMFPTQIAQAGSSTSKQAGQGTEPSAANDTLATAMKPAEMNELSSVQPKSTVDSSSTVVAAGKEQAQPASAAGRIVEIGGIAGSGQGSSQQAADSTLLSGYLDKYYYLGPEDRAKVLVGTDERRYFMMKGRSLEGQANADAALSEAAGSTRLATELRHQATELRNDAQPDNDGKASLLDSRATALEHRSDSLRSAADRLRSMASTDDAQAATWLQSLPVDRSAAIMDLEQRSRRTEPLLARTRPSATVEIPTANAAGEGTRTDSVQASAPAVSAPSPRQSSGVERLASANSVAHPEPQPFTGPLTQNIFTFNGETTERKEAIPIDAPMPQGVVYKVQVGAFRNPLPMEAFSDMAPVTGEHAANGLVRYTAGLFVDAKSAAEAGAKVRARGYRDAFVAAYIDGKRVPLREAMRAEASREGLAVNTPTTAGGTGSQAIAPAPVQLPQASAEESVLAQYPATAEAVLAAFQPASTAYYNDPTAAPAKQVETVKGLFFTVQVGVYSKPTPLDKLFNITPLNSEFTANGKIRYTTGMFGDEGKAQARRTVTVSLGVKDAFITAYLNGKRIPMRDARALLAKYGSAVLAAGLASQ